MARASRRATRRASRSRRRDGVPARPGECERGAPVARRRPTPAERGAGGRGRRGADPVRTRQQRPETRQAAGRREDPGRVVDGGRQDPADSRHRRRSAVPRPPAPGTTGNQGPGGGLEAADLDEVDESAVNGRGLGIVGVLADAWGVEPVRGRPGTAAAPGRPGRPEDRVGGSPIARPPPAAPPPPPPRPAGRGARAPPRIVGVRAALAALPRGAGQRIGKVIGRGGVGKGLGHDGEAEGIGGVGRSVEQAHTAPTHRRRVRQKSDGDAPPGAERKRGVR